MAASDRNSRIVIATSRMHGRVFLAFERGNHSFVMALRPTEDGFHAAYYIELPPRPTLIDDIAGERVYAMATGAEHLVLVELTHDAPPGFRDRFMPGAPRDEDL